jgi:DNA-binding SARP family transcriptional activator/predicted ATPase
MAHLSVRVLGPFQVALAAQPVTAFKSDKVRALLAFLAVESGRPHRRESLVGLLWPAYQERSARVNLRDALANLRQVIGDPDATPPFLHVSRQAVQFNSASDAWVDANAFVQQATPGATRQPDIHRLEEAIGLYRGPFMEGFSLADSPAFEEWALLTRERFHRLAREALRQLAASHEERGEYTIALEHAQRLLELDPLLEAAHRYVMRLSVYSGERAAAIAQYEICRRALETELNVPPSPETERLYQQIRRGELEMPVLSPSPPQELPVQPPAFLNEAAALQREEPIFVAREKELAWLAKRLEQATAGHGQVAFVVGGPGRGKTLLLQAFARQAMARYPDLLVAGGNGNAYSGVGDPYLPFREVLDMLSGDVEARWAAGAIDREHALRLWQALPSAARTLVGLGPDLIDTFVPGRALVGRAAACQEIAPWRTQLEQLVAHKASLPPDSNLQQSALFQQYTRVLADLARQRSLLLILDDLQWIDAGSAGLLFHLGHALPGCRILVLGAYRPEELALGRGGERHPLEAALAEFQRRYGDAWLDLGTTAPDADRRFVEALVDSQPNRLGRAFRDALYRRTEGHPLFTAELLRVMQERGDLVREARADGGWVEGSALDWESLPPKVEAAIAERIQRLDTELREILTVASVEGEEFTAQVVARVQQGDERRVMRLLSGPLEGRHRLVSAQGVRRLDGMRLSLHRFRHNLFQQYVYGHLNEVERAYLHRDVGHALEGLYAGHPEELAAVAPRLALHFQEAGNTEKAVDYLRQAGERANRMSASAEAIAHYTQALRLLETLPEGPERAQTELTLQLCLAVPVLVTRGWAAADMARIVARARELCEQVGDVPQLFGALWFAFTYYLVQVDYRTALEFVEQCRALAERSNDPGLIIVAHYGLASTLLFKGDFSASVARAEPVRELYDPKQHHALTSLMVGHDLGAQSLETAALSLWLLGFPDQARQRMGEALDLAIELAHPYTLAWFYHFNGLLQAHWRDWPQARESAENAVRISSEHDYPITGSHSTVVLGLALTKLGRVEEGLELLQRGVAEVEAAHMQLGWSMFQAWLAEAYLVSARLEDALDTLDVALDFVAESQEGFWEPEIHRLKGEVLLAKRDAPGAEASFHDAIAVARRLSAKSWGLRASMSLARLWEEQGKREQARQTLQEIYGWFSEGFDTSDLREARALLEGFDG